MVKWVIDLFGTASQHELVLSGEIGNVEVGGQGVEELDIFLLKKRNLLLQQIKSQFLGENQ